MPHACEQRFGFDRPVDVQLGPFALRLRGVVDRVDRLADGTYEVSDFKTGSTYGFPDPDDADPAAALAGGAKLQWALYAYALEDAFGWRVTHSSYRFPGEKAWGERRRYRVPDRAAVAEIVAGLAQLARDGFFPPAADAPCTFCDYARVCGDTKREEGDEGGRGVRPRRRRAPARRLAPSVALQVAQPMQLTWTTPCRLPDQPQRDRILGKDPTTSGARSPSRPGPGRVRRRRSSAGSSRSSRRARSTSRRGCARSSPSRSRGRPRPSSAPRPTAASSPGPPSSPPPLDEPGPEADREDAAVRLRRVREALTELDAACIDTIHGFCGRLLRSDALAVGLPPDFAVIEDREADDLRRAFWRRYVREQHEHAEGAG